MSFCRQVQRNVECDLGDADDRREKDLSGSAF